MPAIGRMDFGLSRLVDSDLPQFFGSKTDFPKNLKRGIENDFADMKVCEAHLRVRGAGSHNLLMFAAHGSPKEGRFPC